ncbi:MAG TPA: 2OG-Fe dioxygenase family protein [Steroidobacteraceae bacterium]|nr:2OG-Fe dioxygenase family protein [Steroidobacteraceae bacterium]
MSAFAAAVRELQTSGFARLSPAEASLALGLDLAALAPLKDSWERLPRDAYLRDGGAYRARRHSCFVQVLGATLTLVPHRAHWQPTAYNALHGGLTRWFEPIAPAVHTQPGWLKLLGSLGEVFAAVHPVPRWFIEAHQFRIDTVSGIGRPTPEGAHRDGVDFVAVILVGRRHVIGGETRVFEATGSKGVRFSLSEPWSMLLMDDARVIHETTALQPQGPGGVRDTLVLTYRAGGFQAPDAPDPTPG